MEPTEEDLGSTRIGDCALSQTTLDLGVGGGLLSAPVCAPRRSTRRGTPMCGGVPPPPPRSASRAGDSCHRPPA